MNGHTNFSTNPYYWFREHRFFFVILCSSASLIVTWSWHHGAISVDISWLQVLTPGPALSSPSCHSPELQSGHWTHTSGCDASELTSDGELGMVLWSMTMRPGVRTQGRWESCDHCRRQSVPGQTLTSSHLSLAQQKTWAKIIKRKSRDTKKGLLYVFQLFFWKNQSN